MAVCKPGRRPSPDTKAICILTLDFSASRIVRGKCLLIKTPRLWWFVNVAHTEHGDIPQLIYLFHSQSTGQFPVWSYYEVHCFKSSTMYVFLLDYIPRKGNSGYIYFSLGRNYQKIFKEFRSINTSSKTVIPVVP